MKLDILRVLQNVKKYYGRQQDKTTTFVYHIVEIASIGFFDEIFAVVMNRQLGIHCISLFEDLWKDKHPTVALKMFGDAIVVPRLLNPITINFITAHRFVSSTAGFSPGTKVLLDPDLLDTTLDSWR